MQIEIFLSEYRRNFGESYAEFRDKDIGDMRTAIAFAPIEKDIGRKIFSKFSLA